MAWELAASTLGAPYDSIEKLIGICHRTGVKKLEASVGDEMLFTMAESDDQLKRMRDQLGSADITIISIDSRVQACNPARSEAELVSSLKHCLHMASIVGARFVRVFPSAPLEPHWTPDRLPGLNLPKGQNLASISRRGARIIAQALPLADMLDVQPLIETHDSHPTGERNAMIHAALDRIAPGNRVGSIWDIAHPWRVGEDPQTTFEFLGRYITNGRGLVQIKDCAFRGDQTPVLQGTGRIPLTKICRILRAGGYEGPLSLEWEKRWYPNIPPLKTALKAARTALDALPADAQ